VGQLEADKGQLDKELARVKGEISGKLEKWQNHYSLVDGPKSPGGAVGSPTSPSRTRKGVSHLESRLTPVGGSKKMTPQAEECMRILDKYLRDNQTRINEVFKEVDKDNSKELNRFELGELLQRLGVPYAYDAAKVAALMQAIDTDQNKTCSFSELKKAVDEYRKNKGLDAGDGHIIAAALQANPTVDSIVIGSQDKPGTIPLKQLRENRIEALDFQGKQLLALGGIVLASALRENASVTVLNVSKNALREVGVKTISEMLKANKTLTEVDLSDNQIGAWTQKACEETGWSDKVHRTPEGPAALAEALKSSALQCLNCSSNGLDQTAKDQLTKHKPPQLTLKM
jgi:hypothetical protein